MLETLTWEFDKALLLCDGGEDIEMEEKWDLHLDEIDSWYEGMRIHAMSLGRNLTHVGTFFEDRAVFFYADNLTGKINYIEK